MARGRKRKEQGLQQKQKITIWLTELEKQKLIARAGTMPISRYFRETLLRGRAPKLPPNVPELNWRVYKELSEHIQTLRQFIAAFQSHRQEEQAHAIAQHSARIKDMLEQYRLSLISLSQSKEKENDKQNL